MNILIRMFQLLFFIGIIVSILIEFTWYYALPIGVSGIISFELLHRFHIK